MGALDVTYGSRTFQVANVTRYEHNDMERSPAHIGPTKVKIDVAESEGCVASKAWHLDQLVNNSASRNPYRLECRQKA